MNRLAIMLPLIAWATLHAQDAPTPPSAPPAPPAANPNAAIPLSASTSPTAGQGRPPILIAASSDHATVRLQLTVTTPLEPGDLELGLLTVEQEPSARIVPKVEIVSSRAESGRPADVELRFAGLFPFGESTAALLHQGRQIETLRFHKVGLAVRPATGDVIVAREGDEGLLLLLQNPSTFAYAKVTARLRFHDADLCSFRTDANGTPAAKPPDRDSGRTTTSCLDGRDWSSFTVSPYSQVSLLAAPLPQWFRDRETDRARSAVRAGVMTLRYQGDTPAAVFEQQVPLQVRFEPATSSLSKGIGWVGFYLFMGAMLSLLLRVSVPNYRRKKALKDQLDEARRGIAEISDQVDSQLRVLLRVERLALDQRRREGWVLGPGFDEVAARVESGLATLKRKIVLSQRLDAIVCRREALLDGPVSPTRLDLIERNVSVACDGLKSDQLNDADWIFIQQSLEAAGKILSEPSQEEKQAFEALLSQRWKSIRDHFGRKGDRKQEGAPEATDDNELNVPAALACMADAFPTGALLPRMADVDGTAWIASVGVVRADLQLTALDTIREVQFLAPALHHNPVWADAMPDLTRWLATPAIANLATARRKLLQLAEGVGESDVCDAIRAGDVQIEADPQLVHPNQTVRLTVRFRDPRLHGAIAREAVQCEWCLHEATLARPWSPTLAPAWAWLRSAPAMKESAYEQCERGWRVHRFFEAGIETQVVDARFFYHGKPVTDEMGKPVTLSHTVSPKVHSRHRKDLLERWLWRPAPQALQLFAALLVPLAALAISTAGEATSGRWWDLVGLGFGSETIRNILSGEPSPPPT